MKTAGLQIERLWMAYNSSDSLRSGGRLHSSLEEFVSLGNSDGSRQKFGESTPGSGTFPYTQCVIPRFKMSASGQNFAGCERIKFYTVPKIWSWI